MSIQIESIEKLTENILWNDYFTPVARFWSDFSQTLVRL